MNNCVVLIPVGKLKVHEDVSQKRVINLLRMMTQDKYLKNPLIVDKKTLVVLDGHHRLQALRLLGAKKIPVSFVNYKSRQVRVYLRREELRMELVKEAVILKGLSGQLFPCKTTRHLLKNRVGNVNVKLEKLF